MADEHDSDDPATDDVGGGGVLAVVLLIIVVLVLLFVFRDQLFGGSEYPDTVQINGN